MLCKKCGNEIKDVAVFSAHCGAPVEQKVMGMGTNPLPGGINGIPSLGTQTGGGASVADGNSNRRFMRIGGAVAVLVLVLVGGLGIGLHFGKGDSGSTESGDKEPKEVSESTEEKEEESLVRTWEGEYELLYIYWWQGTESGLYSGLSYDDDIAELKEMEMEMEGFGEPLSAVANALLSAKVPGFLEFSKDDTWKLHVDEDDFYNVFAEVCFEMFSAMDADTRNEVIEEADWIAFMNAPKAERGKVMKELVFDKEQQEELQRLFKRAVWSGSYTVNEEEGEIELTITEAMGEEKSEKVLLEYQVEDGKLSLEVQEDESGIMEPWQEMGFFDKKLSGK